MTRSNLLRVLLVGSSLVGTGACGGDEPADSTGTGGVAATGGSSGSGGEKPDGSAGGSGGAQGSGGAGTGGIPGKIESSGGAGGKSDGGSTGGADAGDASAVDGASDPPVFTMTDCADAVLLDAFRAGAASSGGRRFLYPLDGTVWPRGVVPPVLQWEGGAGGDAVYLKIESDRFLYEGCFPGAVAPYQLAVPADAWSAAAEWSDGAADPASVTLAVRASGVVTAVTQEWRFALATLKGAVYYNAYGSPQLLSDGAAGGVLKVRPGESAPEPFLSVGGIPPLGPCVSCHSLSANGSTLVANNHLYPAGPYLSQSFNVGQQSATMRRDGMPESGLAALYPDGSLAVTNGPPNSVTFPAAGTSATFPMAPNNVPALIGPADSRIVSTSNGSVLAPGPATHAQMPAFSADGRLIAYNDHDDGGGHALFVADFDFATKTFSNHREIFRDTQRYPGWPSFTPDNEAVVFVLGTRDDFVSQLPPLGAPPEKIVTGRSHLRVTYLDSPGTSTPLALANGWRDGTFYLPGGSTRDDDLEFFPAMSRVPAGGYFWLFFTSRRTYGNTVTDDLESSVTKNIWVTAIDIGGAQGTDPSHPAFFLGGQEPDSGNFRPVPALEPCKEDGVVCESGTECCAGYCVNGICAPSLSCSNLDDRCDSSADCCDAEHACMGGYCAQTSR